MATADRSRPGPAKPLRQRPVGGLTPERDNRPGKTERNYTDKDREWKLGEEDEGS